MIAEEWHLTADQQRGLLGFPSTSTFYNYSQRHQQLLSADTLTRLSLVFGIYKDLKIFIRNREFTSSGSTCPTQIRYFADAPPIGMMAFTA